MMCMPKIKEKMTHGQKFQKNKCATFRKIINDSLFSSDNFLFFRKPVTHTTKKDWKILND